MYSYHVLSRTGKEDTTRGWLGKQAHVQPQSVSWTFATAKAAPVAANAAEPCIAICKSSSWPAVVAAESDRRHQHEVWLSAATQVSRQQDDLRRMRCTWT